MSTTTTNLKLHKIDLSDAPPDITVLNQNWDTLDAKLKEHSDKLDSKVSEDHTHDDRYYTESEIDGKVRELEEAIANTSNSNHSHDDKYYTEAEIDNKLETVNQGVDAKVNRSGDTMTGALVAQNNTNYTTKQVRNVFIIADGSSIPSGSNGDICLVYTP
jgi:hypothetical protein